VRTTTGIPISARFPGQWFQSESGLYQNWMRDYDPTTGRYVEADPLGLIDGASVYGYVKQSPGRLVDINGLWGGVSPNYVSTPPTALGIAAGMAVNWATGSAPSSSSFDAGSPMTQGLRNTPNVDMARSFFYSKNAGKSCDCSTGDFESVTGYMSPFGASGYFNSLWAGNAAWHFAGSFAINIYPQPDCQIKFVLTNNSSFTSFAYGLGPSWEGGPMGNYRQTYTWTERIK
jgi:RHS repeat-associated protein